MTALRVDILSLFPDAFRGPLDVSILKRAREAGLLSVQLHDIRDHATDRHRTVDDYPFGGGQGMVLRVDVLDRALQHVQAQAEPPGYVIYLTPQGEVLNDSIVRELAGHQRLVLVAGRYEGVDERFVEHCVDREISIGDYVLTGGELPAMVLVDAVARHIPGALGDEASPHDESFADGLLEHPQYTRPAEYRGWEVPEVLLGGHHADIERWRREQRVARTGARRPDRLPALETTPSAPEKVGIPGIRVRDVAYPEDVPAVLNVLREAYPEGSVPSGASEAARLLEHSPGLLLVATAGGEVVGVIVAGFDGASAHLLSLAVVKEHRRRGIARALVRVLQGRLRERDCEQITAFAAPEDYVAESFLTSQGWQRASGSAWTQRL